MHLSVGKEVKKYAWSVDFAIAHFRSSCLYVCDGGRYAQLIDTMIKVLQDWSSRWSAFEASKSFLNHRSFLSEMEECVVPLQTLLDVLQRRPPKAPIVVVDLCSGKGFLSIMLSYLANEIPLLKQHLSKILMVDSCFGRGKNSINTDYLNVVETDSPRKIPVGCVSGNVFDPWFVRALSNLIHGPPEFMSDITAVPVYKGSFTLTDIRKRLPIESLREMLAERGGDPTGPPEDIRSRLIELCLKEPDTGLDPCSRRFEFHSGSDYMSRFVVKGACRDWNRGACSRKRLCKFKHVCAHCAGQDHPAVSCPLLPESTKQAIASSTIEESKSSQAATTTAATATATTSTAAVSTTVAAAVAGAATRVEPFLPRGLIPALSRPQLLEVAALQPALFAACLTAELKCGDVAYVDIDGWFFATECLSSEGDTVKLRLPVCPQYVQASNELRAKFAANCIELSGQSPAFRVVFAQALAAAVAAAVSDTATDRKSVV